MGFVPSREEGGSPQSQLNVQHLHSAMDRIAHGLSRSVEPRIGALLGGTLGAASVVAVIINAVSPLWLALWLALLLGARMG